MDNDFEYSFRYCKKVVWFRRGHRENLQNYEYSGVYLTNIKFISHHKCLKV
jgi:hypothetical protein